MSERTSPWPKGRGGARAGAGRPRKRDFWSELRIGQACEVLWRQASDQAVAERLSQLAHSQAIRSLQEAANQIPVSERSDWLGGDGYEDHVGDLEAWLHKRGGTAFNDETATYAGNAPRLITVSNAPPRGARKAIIAEVSAQSGASESTVARLWTAYRKLEQKGDEDA